MYKATRKACFVKKTDRRNSEACLSVVTITFFCFFSDLNSSFINISDSFLFLKRDWFCIWVLTLLFNNHSTKVKEWRLWIRNICLLLWDWEWLENKIGTYFLISKWEREKKMKTKFGNLCIRIVFIFFCIMFCLKYYINFDTYFFYPYNFDIFMYSYHVYIIFHIVLYFYHILIIFYIVFNIIKFSEN